MPCNDSSSSICIRLDNNERFVNFEFAKITCADEIKGQTDFCKYLKGKTLEEILDISYLQAMTDLKLADEESKFILHLEWDALRAAIVQYLGKEDPTIDFERCKVISITETREGIEISEIILPPKEMPKILPCARQEKE